MMTESWGLNLMEGILLALIATSAIVESKSNLLVPKLILLLLLVWPTLVILFGVLNLIPAGLLSRTLGILMILCGLQAACVNLRRLAPWPSGGIWLGLVLAGAGFQFDPLFVHRVMGFIWMAIGITKVVRERSASLEGGTPIWILLFYAQAILLASYR